MSASEYSTGPFCWPPAAREQPDTPSPLEYAAHPGGYRLNLLVLYDQTVVYINTVREHLESLSVHSRHEVLYANVFGDAPVDFDIHGFDVVILHYCVRLPYPGYISPAFKKTVKSFRGLKLLFIQDEYDLPDVATAAINELGIDVVFSCVPPQYRHVFYPNVRRGLEFCQVLTGYVSPELEAVREVPALSERKIAIGYRGRELPYRYGSLGREKVKIGQGMGEICQARGIPHDIEWTEDKRLYGQQWNAFLASCRATLGTESGSNVIDRDGSLSATIEKALAKNPDLTFEEAFERFLRPHEGQVVMNQVSPRIFEAIANRTALVLFEGTYSGVVRPDVHFIPLKKDFSNVDEVLEKVRDDRYLEALNERAYRDVILSGKYRYSVMVAEMDKVIQRRAVRSVTPGRLTDLYATAYIIRNDKSWRPVGLFSEPLEASGFYPPAPPPVILSRKALFLLPLTWFAQNIRAKTGLFLRNQGARIRFFRRNQAARFALFRRNQAARIRLFLRNQTARTRLWLRNQVARVRTILGNQAARLNKLMRMAAIYLGQPSARRAVNFHLCRPSLWCSAGLSALWRDLLRLDAVNRARRQGPGLLPAFQVSLRHEPESARLKLISISRNEVGLPQDPMPNWEAIQDAFAMGKVREILWDHSAVGTSCEARMLARGARFALGPDGKYLFSGLTAVGKRSPTHVIRLLRAALAA
jgi:hypothetical protein